MKKLILSITTIFIFLIAYSQSEVTITIGYPDDEGYFVYSIPPTDEHARFGGVYYLKIKNTGSTTLSNWKLNTIWKTINSTWGVVEKTTINPSTGLIELTGPSWDTDLDPNEEIEVSGEWIPVSSVEDWIDFLPREMSFTGNGQSISIVYDTDGTVNVGAYNIEKVKPIDANRKVNANLKTVAYFPTFDYQNAWCSLQKYGENIDQLRIQMYTVSQQGMVQAAPDENDQIPQDIDYWYNKLEALGVFQYCVDHSIEVVPVVFNYSVELNDFDQNSVHTMLSTPSIRTNHINTLMDIVTNHPVFDGIDVDYESLMANDKDLYSSFMEDLSAEVHAEGKLLTTAVHTKVGPGTWYGPKAQDIERIGNAVDEILFMTYDLHWATSPTYNNPPPTAGCQSTGDWMNDVAFFGVSEINDPSKVQLGLPFYGYRWKKDFENHTVNDPGVGLTYQEARDLINEHNVTNIMREPNSNEPYFYVTIDGIDWVCYYQDEISIENKLTSLAEHDLKDFIGGIGIWRLGQESDAIWEKITDMVSGTTAQIDQTVNECIVSIEEENKEKTNISVYPNPSSNSIQILADMGIIKFEIYHITGSLVKKGLFVNEINIEDLTTGEYFIRLISNSSIEQVRFSKL